MAHSSDRILFEQNPILPVFFAGFRSDTLTLSRNGWDVAVSEDYNRSFMDRRLVVALRHRALQMNLHGRGSVPVRFDPRYRYSEPRGHYEYPEVVIQHGGTQGCVYVQGELTMPKMWVDTDPQLVEIGRRELGTFPLFSTPAQVAGESLIVPQHSVPELLDMIRKMQSPEQAEIRERARRRDAMTPRLQAQILAFDSRMAA